MNWSPPLTASAQRFINGCLTLLVEEGRSAMLSLPLDVEPGLVLDQIDIRLDRRAPTDFRRYRLEIDAEQLERNPSGFMEELQGRLQEAEGKERPWEELPIFVLVQVLQQAPVISARLPQELDRWLGRFKAALEAGHGFRVLMCLPAIVNEPRKLEHIVLRKYPCFSAEEFASDLAEVLEQLLPPQPAQLAEYTRLYLLDASGGRAQDLGLLVSALENLERSPEVIAAFARDPWRHPELASAVERRAEELRRHGMVHHCSPSQLHQRHEAPWRLWLLGGSCAEPQTSSVWTLPTARTLAALARSGRPPEFIVERHRAAEQALVSCFNFERKLRMTLIQLAQTPAGLQAYQRSLSVLWDADKGITAQQAIWDSLPEKLRQQDPLHVASFGQLKRLVIEMCRVDNAFDADLRRAVDLRNGLAHRDDGVSYEEFEWLRLLELRWDQQLLGLRTRERPAAIAR